MYTYLCDATSIEDVADYLEEQKEILFDAKQEELADLRLSIILTSKWEALEGLPHDRRVALQEELRNLRRIYFEKVDEIAMSFGVQKAMEAKEEIERSVELAGEMDLSRMAIESEQLYF